MFHVLTNYNQSSSWTDSCQNLNHSAVIQLENLEEEQHMLGSFLIL